MSIDFNLVKGDISSFVYVRPKALNGAVLTGDWTCTGLVYDWTGRKVIDEFAITEQSADNTEFKAYLTQAQTALLSKTGDYFFVVRLDNQVSIPPITKASILTMAVNSKTFL